MPTKTDGEADELAQALDRAQDDFSSLTRRQQQERWGTTGFCGGWTRLPERYLQALAELAMDRLRQRNA